MSSNEVATLIRQLGSASAARRDAAARRLLEIGPGCVPALQRARDHRDPEIAARARDLLDTLDGLMLAGTTVALAVEPAQVRWDQPFDLFVKIQNESPVACNVPFSPGLASLLGLSHDARQAGLALDVADFLQVRGPTGEVIDLHLYDVGDDPAVERVTEARAAGLVYGRLAAGDVTTYRVPAVNRGRARYRMLSAGTYRVQLVYEPDWADAQLAQHHVGRVESNTVDVQVLDDAPPVVRADGAYLRVLVERKGDDLVGRLLNAYDLPVHINLNLNGGTGLYAELHWVVRGSAGEVEVAVPGTGPFDAGRLHRLEPGDGVELVRCSAAEVLGHPTVQPLTSAGPLEVRLRYSSLLSRRNVALLAPGIAPPERKFADRLPAYLITGRFESESLPVSRR